MTSEHSLLLLQIAQEVRSKAESLIVAGKLTPCGPRLRGLCAICSAELAERFRSAGFDAEMRVRQHWPRSQGDHCWVFCEGVNWDVTATQFGEKYPPVVVSKNFRRYKHTHTANNGKYFRCWPEDQRYSKGVQKLFAA